MVWRPGAFLGAWVASIVGLGCTPAASSRSDAGADARAAVTDAGAASDAQASVDRDAAPSDDTNLPAASSDELTSRAKHLLEAVAHDNADLGVDMVFPRDGYAAARDAADPGKAWDMKVVAASLHRC